MNVSHFISIFIFAIVINSQGYSIIGFDTIPKPKGDKKIQQISTPVCKLKIKADLPCTLFIDGKSIGTAKAGQFVFYQAKVGEYELKAVSNENSNWQYLKDLKITKEMLNTEKVEKIDLLSVKEHRMGGNSNNAKRPKLSREDSLRRVHKLDSLRKVMADRKYNSGNPCPSLASFDYEGQTYHTVQIGTQCWMKENLNVGTMISNSVLQSNNNKIEKYCYDNDKNNCRI